MFEKIRKLFKIGPKKFLGIDVGTSIIRIVEIARQGQIYTLENYGEIGTSSIEQKPFRVYKGDALLLSNKKIAKTIQAICKEAGIQTTDANFSIPDFCSFFTSFELPIMSKEEIPKAVSYQVRPYIPLPLSEITLDWTVIKGEVSKTPLGVLVVAIPNDIISQYKEIAFLANLTLKTLEPEVFALARPLVRGENKKKIIGLVDIGARSTTCSVLEQGTLKMSHSFNIAGNELSEAIARSLNIKYNKAEVLKKEYGLLSNSEEVSESSEKNLNKKNIRKVLLPLVDSISEEIKKVFRDFYKKEGKEVEKILLAGGSAFMPGFKKYFSTQLNKEIIIANPFVDIVCPQVLSETLEKIGPSYAAAVGLALKGLE